MLNILWLLVVVAVLEQRDHTQVEVVAQAATVRQH
jgi:hypothetical protein